MKISRILLYVLSIFSAGIISVLAGCATTGHEPLAQAPPGNPSLTQVRGNVGSFVGKRVRWGGTIASVKNRANETEIDIVDRALDRYGRPERTSETRGRFIARVNGFLDPAVYTAGREITVGGTVQGKLTRSIGEYSYTYIVVAADATKLWEPRLPPSYYRSPFYSPFYDPFWPRPFYPWYGPYPFYPY